MVLHTVQEAIDALATWRVELPSSTCELSLTLNKWNECVKSLLIVVDENVALHLCCIRAGLLLAMLANLRMMLPDASNIGNLRSGLNGQLRRTSITSTTLS